MTMSLTKQILTIVMMILGTMLTRFLPFIVFPSGKPPPKYIQYLGKVLPSAVFGLLVIYCFKDVDVRLLSGNHGIPEFLGASVAIFLHFWKRNMFLSISGGTIVYMVLIQLFF